MSHAVAISSAFFGVGVALLVGSCEPVPLAADKVESCPVWPCQETPTPPCWSTRSSFHVRSNASADTCGQGVKLHAGTGYWIAELTP